MKQLILFILLFFFLSFCLFAQEKLIPVESNIGSHINSLESLVGKAKYQSSNRNGTTDYVWVSSTVLYDPLDPDDQWLAFCETHAIVNKYGTIIDYSFKGNACL